MARKQAEGQQKKRPAGNPSTRPAGPAEKKKQIEADTLLAATEVWDIFKYKERRAS